MTSQSTPPEPPKELKEKLIPDELVTTEHEVVIGGEVAR